MPQLNPEFFVSQLFWLVVTFSFLLVFLWRISLPRIGNVLEKRERRINEDLTTAKELQSEAENIQDKIETDYIIVNDTSLIISNANNTYDVLEFTLLSSNQKSPKNYILLNDDPIDIKGDFFINHNNQGLTINFIEEQFSNKVPHLVYRKNGELHRYPMTRNKKNILTSDLFKVDEFILLKDIAIEYDIGYTYSEKLNIETMLTLPEFFNQKTFKNGQITISHEKETFFDTTVIYITHPPIKQFNSQSIIAPFYIGPSSIPFNKPLSVSLFLPSQKELNHMLVCSYDKKKK